MYVSERRRTLTQGVDYPDTVGGTTIAASSGRIIRLIAMRKHYE